MKQVLIGLLLLFLYICNSITYDTVYIEPTNRRTDFGQCWVRRYAHTANNALCTKPEIDNYVRQNEDLTFDEIRDACPGLQYSSCTSMSQLVWPVYQGSNNYVCDCPYCKCGDNPIRTEFSIQKTLGTDNFPKVQCVKCDCLYSTDYAEEIEICSPQTTSAGYLYNEFVCPATSEPTPSPTTPIGIQGCMVNGHEYFVGDSFWLNQTIGDECQTFCVCMKGGNITCSNGRQTNYQEIYQNNLLYYHFLKQCGSVIGDCHEPAGYLNLFQWNTSTDFCHYPNNQDTIGCPRCGCGITQAGEYKETVVIAPGNSVLLDNSNLNNSKILYQCSNCSCTAASQQPQSSYFPNNQCSDRRAGYGNYTSPGDCTQPVYECMSGTASVADGYPKSFNPYCRYVDHYRYCSSYGIDYQTSPNVICDSPETIGIFGCQKDYICEAFNYFSSNPQNLPSSNPTSQCYSQNITISSAAYDCSNDQYNTEDITLRIRVQCCTGSFCNNRTIASLTNCDGGSNGNNKALEAYFKAMLTYNYGIKFDFYKSDNDYAQLRECNQPLRYRNYWSKIGGSSSKICQYLSRYYQELTGAECVPKTALINALKGQNAQDLINVIQNELNQTTLWPTFVNNFKRYHDYYGCSWKPACEPSHALMFYVSFSVMVITIISWLML